MARQTLLSISRSLSVSALSSTVQYRALARDSCVASLSTVGVAVLRVAAFSRRPVLLCCVLRPAGNTVLRVLRVAESLRNYLQELCATQRAARASWRRYASWECVLCVRDRTSAERWSPGCGNVINMYARTYARDPRRKRANRGRFRDCNGQWFGVR